jgi:hypothetical protein
MRFMMLMIPGEHPDREAVPADAIEKMMAYYEELTKAGVVLDGAGLHPPAEAARVTYAGATPSV